MEFWLAASLFFGGALCYGIVAKVMDIGHSYKFVKKTTDQMVMLLISVSQDVAFIKSLKYETMEDMKVPEEQIELVKKLDDETFKAWKEITFLKIVQIYPKQYVKLLNGYDWSKVTQSVDNLYK
jgi:hypothetical protein|tara:strand:+ start:343 stop:714 length:372 start_codon:yes stop_codon:yes gene_type:complete